MARINFRFAAFLVASSACSSSSGQVREEGRTKSVPQIKSAPATPISEPSDSLEKIPTQNDSLQKSSQESRAQDSLSTSMDDDKNPLILGDLEFNDVSIGVKVLQPKEGKPVVAQLHVKGFPKTLRVGFVNAEYADSLQVTAEELPAFSNPRLVMIQLFMESGEDAFSRSMVTSLVFLGDQKSPPKILWRGEGAYQSYSGECQIIDVVYFVPEGNKAARIVREQETIVSPPDSGEWENGDAKNCTAKPKTKSRLETVTIP